VFLGCNLIPNPRMENRPMTIFEILRIIQFFNNYHSYFLQTDKNEGIHGAASGRHPEAQVWCRCYKVPKYVIRLESSAWLDFRCIGLENQTAIHEAIRVE
jgi:hypothetical protein